MRYSLKHFLPRTLFARSLMILITPVLLIQIVATVVFFNRHWDTISNRLAWAVAGDIAVFVRLLEDDPAFLPMLEPLALEMTDLTLSVGTTAVPQACVCAEPEAMRLAEALRQRPGERPFDIRVFDKEVVVHIALTTGDTLQISTPRRRLHSSTPQIFLGWMLASSLLLITIAILFMRNQIRSIRRLALAADALGKGQTVDHFKPEGAREVRQAGQAFLKMRDRIDRFIEQRTLMLAGVSHDLRTPLTRMTLQLALLEQTPLEQGENDPQALAQFRQDIAHMNQMIDAYLDFARGAEAEAFTPQDIVTIVRSLVDSHPLVKDRVQIHGLPSLTLSVRPHAIHRCLDNLLTNACRYGEQVHIHIAQTATHAAIVFEDNGPGIPADRRDDMFRPFTRLEDSRNLETGGAGLGLAIARDIARSHGGDIVLESSTILGGLKAILRLPL